MNEGTLLAIVIPSATVLAGILVNNHGIGDLNSRLLEMQAQINVRFDALDKRLDLMKDLFDEKLKRVEDVMDARLTRIEHELKIR